MLSVVLISVVMLNGMAPLAFAFEMIVRLSQEVFFRPLVQQDANFPLRRLFRRRRRLHLRPRRLVRRGQPRIRQSVEQVSDS
jgi:hypothetical protein